jgi:hypothetical protein
VALVAWVVVLWGIILVLVFFVDPKPDRVAGLVLLARTAPVLALLPAGWLWHTLGRAARRPERAWWELD